MAFRKMDRFLHHRAQLLLPCYASIFIIKEFLKQWRPSTAKSKHSIMIRLILLIKKENNKANIPDYPLIHQLCTGSGIWWQKLWIDSFQSWTSGHPSSLHFELTIELVQPFLKNCTIYSCFLLRSVSAREVTNVFEASWTGRFTNHEHQDLPTKDVRVAIPLNRTLLCLPHEQRLLQKCFAEQTKFICIKHIF